jgi:hypothetical protein
MTHTTVLPTVPWLCLFAKYLDFLIRIFNQTVSDSHMQDCAATVFWPHRNGLFQERFIKVITHHMWGTILYEIKYGSVGVCVCVSMVCGRTEGCTNMLSKFGLFQANTRILTDDYPTELNAGNMTRLEHSPVCVNWPLRFLHRGKRKVNSLILETNSEKREAGGKRRRLNKKLFFFQIVMVLGHIPSAIFITRR